MTSIELISGWVIGAGSAILLAVAIVRWLLSYHTARSMTVRSGDWFFGLPVRLQIVGGLVGTMLLAYLGYLFWSPLPLGVSREVDALLRIAGLALFLLGWVLALWSRWALGAMYGVSTSTGAPLQAQHRLIQNGPYAFVRHPMYLGYWLLLAGITLAFRTWTPLVFLMMCLVSFYRRARREDAALAERFGAQWRAYAAQTRFLVPWLY